MRTFGKTEGGWDGRKRDQESTYAKMLLPGFWIPVTIWILWVFWVDWLYWWCEWQVEYTSGFLLCLGFFIYILFFQTLCLVIFCGKILGGMGCDRKVKLNNGHWNQTQISNVTRLWGCLAFPNNRGYICKSQDLSLPEVSQLVRTATNCCPLVPLPAVLSHPRTSSGLKRHMEC